MPNLLISLIGLFSILGGILNWNWFMNSWRARFFVNVFGRNGARISMLGWAFFWWWLALYNDHVFLTDEQNKACWTLANLFW